MAAAMVSMESCVEMFINHKYMEKYIREQYSYTGGTLQFFRERPEQAYEISRRTEEKLSMAFIMYNKGIAELKQMLALDSTVIAGKDEMVAMKNAVIAVKDEMVAMKNTVIAGKDETMLALREKAAAESENLSRQLATANTENLKLAQALSVRGMIEKVELQFSELRRTMGGGSRRKIWTEILDANESISAAVSKECAGKSAKARSSAAIQIILDIYEKASKDVHTLGYDQIPLSRVVYHGHELAVLRALCVATHYLFREI